MRRNFTLPELQDSLDGMREGALLQISRRDDERLFGLNDVAVARLRNFARGHDCVASFADAAVLFRKRIASEREKPAS